MMRLQWLLLALPCLSFAAQSIQTKPIIINQVLVNKITTLSARSSNAYTIEKMIGAPSACIPTSNESWICQWKNNLNSSGIRNTLNISFEAGMVTEVLGIDEKGTFLRKKEIPRR
jgi:hypothetical protein